MTTEIESYDAPLGILGELELVQEIGLLHLKGYNNSEISRLVSDDDKTISPVRVKKYIQEYLSIVQSKVDDDPYFLEKVQFNTLKLLAEFDEISKEAWETLELVTQEGMVAARTQALKLIADITAKKAALHQLMGGNKSTDADYINRMQKAEAVNQILSRVLRDVVADCPRCSERARVDLQQAMAMIEIEEIPDNVIDV